MLLSTLLLASGALAPQTFDSLDKKHLPLDSPTSLYAAPVDVDGDGDLDVVLARGQVLLFLNEGAASFADATSRLPARSNASAEVVAGDVDGDRDMDLLIGGSNPAVLLFRNDGASGFTDQTANLPAAASASSLNLADFDADGDLDLVFHDTAREAFFENDGTGTFTDTSATRFPAATTGGRELVHADVDRDGDLDLFQARFQSLPGAFPSRLLLNDGNGAFTDAPASIPTVLAIGARFADVDGDRDQDLVVHAVETNPFRTDLRVLLGDGAGGRFTDAGARGLPAPSLAGSFAVADVDGDTAPDVLAFDFRGAELALNDGRGAFTPDTADRLPPGLDGVLHTAVADLDGDRDLMFRRLGPEPLKLWLNGGGSFAPGGTVPQLPAGAQALELGDVDGDGDVDVLLGRTLLSNDGSANFADASSRVPPLLDVVSDVALVDVDGDGDPDAFVARTGFGAQGGQDVLLENRGGTFVDVTLGRVPVALDHSIRVTALDIDGDGDTDLSVRTNRGDKLLVNDGSGVFRRGSVDAPTGRLDLRLSAAADVDLDGDLDVVHVDRVLRNLERQLHAPLVPVVGGFYRLQLFAASASAGSATAFPFLATRRVRIPLPPLGVLGLDPATAVPMPPVPIPGGSVPGTLALPVPANAQLIGIDLFTQAVVVDGPLARLTNVLADRIH